MTCVDAGKIHLGREKRRPIPPPQPLPKGPLILVLRRQSETPREGPALFPSPQETVFLAFSLDRLSPSARLAGASRGRRRPSLLSRTPQNALLPPVRGDLCRALFCRGAS